MDYHIFWIDRYVKGARVGPTHGADETSSKTLCGLPFDSHFWDGGYETTETTEIECKKCLKAIVKSLK